MRFLVTALILSIVVAVLAAAGGPSRTPEPPRSRGGHAACVTQADRYGIGTGVVSRIPPVVG